VSTKSKILELAIALIQERGVMGWSYEDISQAVGIRKSSIHYHFPKKEDLFVAACESYIGKATAGLSVEGKSGEEAIWRLAEVYQGVLESEGKTCLCQILTYDIARHSENLQGVLTVFFEELEAFLRGALLKGQEDGEFRKEINVKQQARFLLSAFQGLLILGNIKKTEFEQTVQDYLRLLKPHLEK